MSLSNARRGFLAGSLALVVGASARGDILAPGSKRVSHKFRFENLKDYQAEYKFFFYPLNDTVGPDGLKEQDELNKSGVVHVSGIGLRNVAVAKGMFLVAVPRAMLNAQGGVDEKVLENPPAGVLKSERLVSQIRAVPKEDKDEFWTVYTVTIKDGKLQTGLMRHDEPKKRDELKTTSLPQATVATLSALISLGVLGRRMAVGRDSIKGE